MALKVTVEMDITPREGQSQEEAENQFYGLFSQYLTSKEDPFRTDYGPDAWGGYDGPFVKDVAVTRL